ncbi:MAG: hypothetical protein ABIG40_00700 [Parcubacteria group bacterium]
MSFKIIKLKQIKAFCRAMPLVLAEKSFLASLLFILFALILGGILYYRYDFLASENEPQPNEVSLTLQNKAYLSVMAEWQERQAKFDSADFKNWPDPFLNSGLTE